MPYVTCLDGVRLYYEETGSGNPVLFVHEFLGDLGAWQPQVRHFSKNHRVIVFNARGYPPSDVPRTAAAYSFEHQRGGILAVLDGLGLDRAHIVGLSMGAFAAFYFGMRWPERVLSMTLAGIGSGSAIESRTAFHDQSRAAAAALKQDGWEVNLEARTITPTRIQFRNKDPRGFALFVERVARHSVTGSALTLEGYQALRPSLLDFKSEMASSTVPTLIICGDEDEPCLDASIALKREMPWAELAVMPRTGHACNLEEPGLFNRLTERFLQQVENGQFQPRDPIAIPGRMI